jgi:hypothetical protein
MEYSLDLSVSMHEEHHLYAKSRVQVNGRKTSAVVREALMLQARGFCTLLSMVNCVSF